MFLLFEQKRRKMGVLDRRLIVVLICPAVSSWVSMDQRV